VPLFGRLLVVVVAVILDLKLSVLLAINIIFPFKNNHFDLWNYSQKKNVEDEQKKLD
jgi:hypothetical protein